MARADFRYRGRGPTTVGDGGLDREVGSTSANVEHTRHRPRRRAGQLQCRGSGAAGKGVDPRCYRADSGNGAPQHKGRTARASGEAQVAVIQGQSAGPDHDGGQLGSSDAKGVGSGNTPGTIHVRETQAAEGGHRPGNSAVAHKHRPPRNRAAREATRS